MQTELEQTQLEIARAQLAQEQIKLGKMQQRQRVAASLGQGATAVGGAAASGAGSVLRYAGRWLWWAVGAELAIVLALAIFTKPHAHPDGFWVGLGYVLGTVHVPNTAAVLLAATVLAGLSAGKADPARDQVLQILLAAIPLTVFALWAYFR